MSSTTLSATTEQFLMQASPAGGAGGGFARSGSAKELLAFAMEPRTRSLLTGMVRVLAKALVRVLI
eukprot:CAMPEP_0174911812 /NCGR_PEP_ID=MMETSP0167-20121228/78310_1 /TAXON_ID=38298 /ORGANISM="Rhodella maculata, Strain CCMP736" /LENGTH=65 /DNA_ID=CAMNT_0016156395 /DNA_START=97 /DNA_END=294 /DNA_ORIENTATION=-